MPATKRTLQAMATRERIRTAVMQLLESRTLDEISVQDICAGAGVGVGTFYHYYKSKNDIVLGVFGDLDAQFLKLAADAEADGIDTYEYILRHIICYTRFIQQATAPVVRKVYTFQSKLFLDKSRPIHTALKAFLETKRKNGQISGQTDTEALCDYVNIWLRGLGYDWCLRDGQYDLVQKALAYADPILAGYKVMLSR